MSSDKQVTHAKLAEVVANARSKVEAGNADCLDNAVVALAEGVLSNRQTVLIQRRVLRKLTEGGMVFTCTHCGFAQSDGPLPGDHWRTCEKHPARAERDAMTAENARLRRQNTRLVALLERVIKYAREDKMVTPGVTRLARVLDEATALLAEVKGGA